MRAWMSAVIVGSAVLLWAAGAGAQGSCPPWVASLVPSNGANTTCSYNASGDIGLGSTKADLPFDHVCTRGDKYPARLTAEVQRQGGQAAKLFQMQIAAVEQQTIQNERSKFEKATRGLSSNPQVENFSGVKTEGVPGGTLLYYSYERDCSEGEKRSKPVVALMGVAHNASSSVKVEVNGYTTIDKAKAAASEVIANLMKANTH